MPVPIPYGNMERKARWMLLSQSKDKLFQSKFGEMLVRMATLELQFEFQQPFE